MHVGAGHGNAEQDALKLGRQMQSAALLAATDRVRPVANVLFRPHQGGVDDRVRPVELAWAPSSSRTARCIGRHSAASVLEVRRRRGDLPDGSSRGGQAPPLVGTYTIAVNPACSSSSAVPPP